MESIAVHPSICISSIRNSDQLGADSDYIMTHLKIGTMMSSMKFKLPRAPMFRKHSRARPSGVSCVSCEDRRRFQPSPLLRFSLNMCSSPLLDHKEINALEDKCEDMTPNIPCTMCMDIEKEGWDDFIKVIYCILRICEQNHFAHGLNASHTCAGL